MPRPSRHSIRRPGAHLRTTAGVLARALRASTRQSAKPKSRAARTASGSTRGVAARSVESDGVTETSTAVTAVEAYKLTKADYLSQMIEEAKVTFDININLNDDMLEVASKL